MGVAKKIARAFFTLRNPSLQNPKSATDFLAVVAFCVTSFDWVSVVLSCVFKYVKGVCCVMFCLGHF